MNEPEVDLVGSEGLVRSEVVCVGDAPAFDEVVLRLPVPVCVVDRAGLIEVANHAFATTFTGARAELHGEPFLGWVPRASDRVALGRLLRSLREAPPGTAATVTIELAAVSGGPLSSILRCVRLASGHASVTVLPAGAEESVLETGLGRATTRALDVLHQGVLLVDADGRIVRANPCAAQILGDRLVGRSLLELAPPEGQSAVSDALSLAQAGSWQGGLEFRGQDGESVPVEVSLAGAGGVGALSVVLFRDLREQRRREFEERVVALIDRRLVASADVHAAVMGACAGLIEALPVSLVAVLARVRGGWQRWEVGAGYQAPVVSLPAGVEPPVSWSQTAEFSPLTPSEVGGPLFGERWVETQGLAWRMALWAPTGVTGHLVLHGQRPLDARDRALVQLLAPQIALGLANGLLALEARALAAYQAMVLDQTSVLINSVDHEGRVVTWNRASERLMGLQEADARGRRFGLEVARAESPAKWEEIWTRLLAEGVISTEVPLAPEHGPPVPLHLEARLLREGDVAVGAVFVGLDLRERRGLEQQVLRSQKLAAVGLLAAGIAHEINNPLSGVVGYAALLLEGSALGPAERSRVEKIAASAARCQKIVEGILLFSRKKDGGVRERVDVQRPLRGVIALGEYQWRMHNVRIVCETEAVEVMADPDQLEQVCLNLLSNAVDAMPRGGTIWVKLTRGSDGGAVLRVTDEGQGIPEEIQSRIFDPFFSTKEIGKGTGLGLAISYGIVRDHGGDILVASRAGEGTTFTVTIPGWTAASAAAEQAIEVDRGLHQDRNA